MARWNEGEFIKHAQGLAEQHVVTKKSLNELSQKFSQENNLNPEEIRTLVRLANVATFQELFKRKDSGDKMVEFETGDPEAVIRNMLNASASTPETANINNDKLGSELPDLMREKRQGFKFSVVTEEKVAAYEEKPARLDIAVMTLRKLASEFAIEKIAAGMAWENTLGTLAAQFKRAPGYGPNFEEFEKAAWADLGTTIHPEMAFLYEELRIKRAPPSQEKIAHLQTHLITEDSKETALLKQAYSARQTYQKMANALVWIEKNMPALGR